jgi:hypothetical protein
MSHYAQGWAQRQKVGDPVAKAVLLHMCYVMRDETLLVYVGVPALEEYTEYEERAIRKAIARLAELGFIVDTGKKRNNVTVWRIPGYEQWLAAQIQSPPVQGRATQTDAAALAQVAELVREKTSSNGQNSKPPRIGEGSIQAPPSASSSPPVHVPQALPSTGPYLNPDLNRSLKSDDPRASPTGSRVALDSKGNPFDAQASRAFWYNFVHASIVCGAVAEGIAAFGARSLEDIPHQPRAVLKPILGELTEFGVCEERSAFPNFTAKSRKGVEAEIESRVRRELKPCRPKTASERQAADAEAA